MFSPAKIQLYIFLQLKFITMKQDSKPHLKSSQTSSVTVTQLSAVSKSYTNLAFENQKKNLMIF